MPEYLAPGVYIEETSFRPKSIEGVSTSTAGFVGPARYGPIQGEPELLTSFADFERIYGGLDPFVFDDSEDEVVNYLAQGVRSFFEEGGKRCYVARVYAGEGGRASATLAAGSLDHRSVTVRARHPGRAGEVPVRFTVRIGPNVLAPEPPVNAAPALDSQGRPLRTLRGAAEGDVVWVRDVSSPISTPPGNGTLYWVDRYFDDVDRRYRLRLRRDDPANDPPTNPLELWSDSFDEARIVTVSVTVGAMGKLSESRTWENLAFHPGHRSGLGKIFEAGTQSQETPRKTELYVPLEIASDLTNGAEIAEVLLGQPTQADPTRTVADTLNDPRAGDAARTFQVLLRGGSDGARPGAEEYEGNDGALDGLKSGLRALEDVDDISIVAAPGSTANFADDPTDVGAILRLLIGHAERMLYRIAVLDSAPGQLVSEVRDYRGQLDSRYAALYYPWIRIFDPISEGEILVPPSGSVAGIYARNDIENGVHKAPANEVVRQALGFEIPLSKGQQDVLNPEGINAFRFFEGRGYRLWGARTISSDPEWKYVNLRRYFIYLEKSIEKGTQWAVFENNGPRLWNNVSRTVDGFLFNEFANGRLFGTRSQEAYFVRCDLSTMTQNDLDNGRLVCLIGVSPLRPAEFVIFRIGQWTADRRA